MEDYFQISRSKKFEIVVEDSPSPEESRSRFRQAAADAASRAYSCVNRYPVRERFHAIKLADTLVQDDTHT